MVHSFIHPSVHSFIHLFVHSYIHSFILSFLVPRDTLQLYMNVEDSICLTFMSSTCRHTIKCACSLKPLNDHSVLADILLVAQRLTHTRKWRRVVHITYDIMCMLSSICWCLSKAENTSLTMWGYLAPCQTNPAAIQCPAFVSLGYPSTLCCFSLSGISEGTLVDRRDDSRSRRGRGSSRDRGYGSCDICGQPSVSKHHFSTIVISLHQRRTSSNQCQINKKWRRTTVYECLISAHPCRIIVNLGGSSVDLI